MYTLHVSPTENYYEFKKKKIIEINFSLDGPKVYL